MNRCPAHSLTDHSHKHVGPLQALEPRSGCSLSLRA